MTTSGLSSETHTALVAGLRKERETLRRKADVINRWLEVHREALDLGMLQDVYGLQNSAEDVSIEIARKLEEAEKQLMTVTGQGSRALSLPYVCPHCERRFANPRGRDVHLRVHTKPKR